MLCNKLSGFSSFAPAKTYVSMDYFLYTMTGFVAAVLGALPPGAVNLSVVYTTIRRGAGFAIPIILAAAVGEIILSFFALHCTMTVETYIQHNIFIQYLIAGSLIVAGMILIIRRAVDAPPPGSKKNRGFLKGLLLAVVNPPVLVFWLVAFAFISSHTAVRIHMGMLQLVCLFFVGIFLGKIFALWIYVQLSKRIAKRAGDIKNKLNRGIGLLLLIIGIIQLSRLIA